MPIGVPNVSPSPTVSTDSRKIWIVLIGVNAYQDQAFTKLRYSVKDCLGLEEILQRVTDERFASRQFLVHSERPTLNEVCGSLERIAREARPQDVVLIYFSGHGATIGQDLYFCLADTWQDRLETTGLALERLLGYLENCAASQQLLWSDACYSGGLPSSNADANQSTLFRDVLQTRAQQNQGFYALLSCTASQRAWEFPEIGNGVFTYFLIKGLEGGAADEKKLIEVDQLYTYVSQQTERFIHDVNSKRKFLNDQNIEGGKDYLDLYPLQTPYRIVGGAGRLVLGRSPDPDTAAVQVQRQALVMNEFVSSAANIDFCRALRDYGDFDLSYWQAQNRSLNEAENIQINVKNLQTSITKLLRSDPKATVLLYFRGKVKREGAEILLMYSNTVGVKFTWLRDELSKAEVCYWILILDCPGAESIYDLIKPDEKKNFCILASEHSATFPQVLTRTLSESDPKFGLSLPAWIVSIEKRLREQQQKLYRWYGGDEQYVMIAPERLAPLLNRDLNLCPYLGLKTFTEKDVSYFFGREEIITQLLEMLESCAFLAVVGASGSGKSSVVQAGLVPRFRQRQIGDSERWDIQTIRPGITPFNTLARALITSNIPLELIKEKLEAGAEAFLDYLESRDQPCLLLIIDQFEELLTLAPKEDSEKFIDLLLNMLEKSTPKTFKLVITLRSDFYVSDQLPLELNRRVIQSNLTLIPMDANSYREVIEEPAKRVGLEVEQNLVIQLLEDLKGSAGDLPLLAFVLEALWTKREKGKLTLAAYRQMEGIQGTLSRRANDIYNRMNLEQQDCLRWILISLTKLGEKGALDSRQRIPKSKLFVKNYRDACVEETLQKLVNEKLVVVDFGSENQVVVEVAHEVLIRKWDKLEGWLNKSREQIQVLREFQSEAEQWQNEDKKEEYLLRGSQLEKIEIAPPEVMNSLSEEEQSFLQACKDNRAAVQRQEQRRLRIAQGVTLFISGLLVVTLFLAYIATQRAQEVQQSQIGLLNTLAISDREKHPLNALMKSMQAAHLLKHTSGASPELVDETTRTLRYVLGMNQEVNRLEGHTDMVQTIAFSPDGKFLISGGHDNTVRIWSKEGKLIKTLTGHKGYVASVAFSPNGKFFASIDREGIVKFWDLNGNCLRTFVAHPLGATRLIFSPDHQQLVSSGRNGSIKFWDYNGKLLKTVQAHKEKIWTIAFSPDGTLLASASSDGSIKLWTSKGVLFRTLSGHKGFVTGVTFSPNSQQLISSGNDKTLRFWSREGKSLRVLQGFERHVVAPQYTKDGRYLIFSVGDSSDIHVHNLHSNVDFVLTGNTEPIVDLKISPNNKYIASASQDKTVRVWKIGSDFRMVIKNDNFSYLTWLKANNLIAIMTYEGKVNFYKPLTDYKASIKAHPSPLRDLAFSLDENSFATLGYEGVYKQWSTNNLQLKNIVSSAKSVVSINILPNSQHILGATSDGRLQFLNQSGKIIRAFSAHKGRILQVTLSPDGQKILTNCADGSIKLWSIEGKLLKVLSSSVSTKSYAAFSPNGQFIAVSHGGNAIEILDIKGALVLSFPVNKKINFFRFSPDGKFIAILFEDLFFDVWNVEGKRISSLGTLPNASSNFDFSPDGKKLLTFGSSDSLLFWNWQTDLSSLSKQSCTELHDYLSNNTSLTKQEREICQDL